jgi:hypothetical protein
MNGANAEKVTLRGGKVADAAWFSQGWMYHSRMYWQLTLQTVPPSISLFLSFSRARRDCQIKAAQYQMGRN